MKRLRFTIASLLLMVVFVAVGIRRLAAEATDLWDSGVFGVTLLAPGFGAPERPQDRRASGVLVGVRADRLVYLALSLVPPVAARLPTSKGPVAYLDSRFPTG